VRQRGESQRKSKKDKKTTLLKRGAEQGKRKIVRLLKQYRKIRAARLTWANYKGEIGF